MTHDDLPHDHDRQSSHHKKSPILATVYLVLGCIAIVIGTVLLLDIALGLFLLAAGGALVHRYTQERTK